MNRLALIAALALLASACSVKRVPASMLAQLPYESRIELLEAENALAVAMDRVDEARAERARLRRAIQRTEALLGTAETERDSAKDPALREVASLAVSEARARRDHQRALRAWRGAQLEVETLALRCASLRFEESRLKIVRELKVAGSEALSPEDFRRQTAGCEEDEKESRAALAKEEAPVKAALAAWEQQRDALAGRTYETRASVYVE